MRFQQHDSESKVNLTPMLDVVFIMLIFFIVTATIVKEVGLDASAPEPKRQPPEPSDNIVVKIESNDQLIVDGRYSDPRAVGAHLLRLHAERPKAVVVIDAHPSSSVEILVLVMDSARLAGADVTMAKRA